MIFIKIIYWLFEKQILKIYFNKQSKSKGFSDMIKAFVDSNGVQYYTWSDDFEIPINRAKEIEKRLMRLKAGLSDENIALFCETMEVALNKGTKPDLAMIGFLVKEMKARQDMLLHPDLMFDLIALKYVRSDEKPHEVSEKIMVEKVEQFKKDSGGGLYSFFYERGILNYLPYIQKLESDWDTLWKQSEAKLKAMQMISQDYITKSK